MCTIRIETLTPLDRASRIKIHKKTLDPGSFVEQLKGLCFHSSTNENCNSIYFEDFLTWRDLMRLKSRLEHKRHEKETQTQHGLVMSKAEASLSQLDLV